MMFRHFYEYARFSKVEEPFMTALSASQRFVLKKSVVEFCEPLARNPNRLAEMLPAIPVPFPNMWIEFPSDDIDYDMAYWWQESAGLGNARKGGAMLILAPKNHRDFKRLHYVFDFTIVPPTYAINEDDADDEISLEAVKDLGQEVMSRMLALWAVIGTRNATQSSPVDFTKLNKQRAKAGKYPLHAYSEVRMNIDAPVVGYSPSPAVATGNRPFHWVRGHMRTLASGRTIPVRSHSRGNEENGTRNHHYTVHRAEDCP